MYHHAIFFLLLSVPLLALQAQGDADAGASTAGSLGQLNTIAPGLKGDSLKQGKMMHSYRISEAIAVGEDNVKIITSYLDLYLQLSDRIQFQVRGPINMARTKEVKTVSLGDIFLINTFRAVEKGNHSLNANLGVKLPTNQSNLTYQDSILPMVYQSSLGTFDAILGVSYTWEHKLGNLSSGIAYQQPFMHINHNKAPGTTEFRRKADVLARIDPVFNIKGRADIGAGLLYIFHAKNDTRLNILEKREEIAGSKGSTLNITGMLNIYISKNFELGTTFGMPVASRDTRPEGLSRNFVVNPYVQFNF